MRDARMLCKICVYIYTAGIKVMGLISAVILTTSLDHCLSKWFHVGTIQESKKGQAKKSLWSKFPMSAEINIFVSEIYGENFNFIIIYYIVEIFICCRSIAADILNWLMMNIIK